MKIILRQFFLLLNLILIGIVADSQDINDSIFYTTNNRSNLTISTFKATRLIDQHTIEVLGKRTLDFRISHRFGPINSKAYNAWGIDGPANIHLGLEYSFDGRLMIGIGRTSYEKMTNAFLKYKWFRQTDDNKMPLTITLFTGIYRTALKVDNSSTSGFNKYQYSADRLSYCFEIIAARKFNSNFSLQINPWFVHYNLVDNINDRNDCFGVSGAARFKFTKRSAITIEYAYRINNYSIEVKYFDSMSIGYELETGGHVFQIHLTNSFGITENQFLTHTDSKWNDMGIRLGFNISRVFSL